MGNYAMRQKPVLKGYMLVAQRHLQDILEMTKPEDKTE